jgi:hypothetical protein
MLALRQQLAVLQPPARVGTAAIPTGLASLDAALSDGGLPSGRLTEILGKRGSGRATLVRQLVGTAVAAQRRVAIVDGSRTLAPRDWAAVGDSGRLWIIRPPQPDRGAWCADILLRSGAFSLVVLDGVPPLARPVAIRLTRLAREHDAALVIAAEDSGGLVGSAVRMRISRKNGSQVTGRRSQPDVKATDSGRTAQEHHRLTTHSRITITLEKGGTRRSVEVSCAIDMARRLRAHPEVPDRRGVATRNRRGERVISPHRHPTAATRSREREPGAVSGTPHAEGPDRPAPRERIPSGTGSTLARKRRFAEPLVRREEFLLPKVGCR